MLANVVKGIWYYVASFSYIGKMRLGKYFLYSGLLGLAVMAAAGLFVYLIFPILSGLFLSIIPFDISWLGTATDIGSIVGGSVFFLIIFKYLMLIVTSPLMSRLSEEVEIHLSGAVDRKVSLLNIVKETIRGARVALRNIVRELSITLLLFIIGFVPVIGMISAPLILITQAYYAGFGNLDFWAERHYNYSNTVKFMKNHKGMCIGNGLPYVFLLAIPILGVFLAPPLATIAGTLHAHGKTASDFV